MKTLAALACALSLAAPAAAHRPSGPLGASWVELTPTDLAREGLAVMATEVTRAQWLMVFGAPAPAVEHHCDAPQCPIAWVTGYAMMAFANRLSDLEGLPRCYALDHCTGAPHELAFACDPPERLRECVGFRLPEVREWALAATAGGQGCADASCLAVEAWTRSTSQGAAHPVATLAPNAWELYDLWGNVSEAAFNPDAASPWGGPGWMATVGCAFHNDGELCRDGIAPPARLADAGSTEGFRLYRTIPAAVP
jgi:hypothetical protein